MAALSAHSPSSLTGGYQRLLDSFRLVLFLQGDASNATAFYLWVQGDACYDQVIHTVAAALTVPMRHVQLRVRGVPLRAEPTARQLRAISLPIFVHLAEGSEQAAFVASSLIEPLPTLAAVRHEAHTVTISFVFTGQHRSSMTTGSFLLEIVGTLLGVSMHAINLLRSESGHWRCVHDDESFEWNAPFGVRFFQRFLTTYDALPCCAYDLDLDTRPTVFSSERLWAEIAGHQRDAAEEIVFVTRPSSCSLFMTARLPVVLPGWRVVAIMRACGVFNLANTYVITHGARQHADILDTEAGFSYSIVRRHGLLVEEMTPAEHSQLPRSSRFSRDC